MIKAMMILKYISKVQESQQENFFSPRGELLPSCESLGTFDSDRKHSIETKKFKVKEFKLTLTKDPDSLAMNSESKRKRTLNNFSSLLLKESPTKELTEPESRLSILKTNIVFP